VSGRRPKFDETDATWGAAVIFTTTYRRDSEGFWLVELREEPRVRTFGRTLDEAAEHIRRATASWFNRPADSFEFIENID
jgi:predicted RNase H-like HicB family nuclease